MVGQLLSLPDIQLLHIKHNHQMAIFKLGALEQAVDPLHFFLPIRTLPVLLNADPGPETDPDPDLQNFNVTYLFTIFKHFSAFSSIFLFSI